LSAKATYSQNVRSAAIVLLLWAPARAARPQTSPAATVHLGPEARALEIVSSLPADNDVAILANLWGPPGRAARRAPGFAEFARKIGFADLWERYGPPDGCRRVAPRDYACD